MKVYLLIFLFLFTLNCSINKVSNLHGYRSMEDKYIKILPAKTNKNDLRKIIGPPSSISKFDDIWFYIERKKTNQSLYKLGKKKISSNNILIVEFNSLGLVEKKSLLDLNDMNDLMIAEKKTEKKFSQNNLVYNILSTLREKVNAPTRNRKK
tara:strand:- start:42 stop:497 length:456 start_codon:yes stop_codon:yes gene_type:complete